MLRNKIPLCAFIGILAIVFGLFFLALGLLIVVETSGRIDGERLAVMLTPMVSGGALLLSGIGLLNRKSWARKVINFVLFALLILAGVLVYFFILEMLRRTYWRNIPEQVGVILFIFSSLASLFLFINNTRVMDELTEKKEK